MIVYIDESGIHKQDGKSVVALVYVVDGDREELEDLILRAEKQANIHYFHWSRRNWRMRNDFFEVISRGNLRLNLHTFLIQISSM